MSRRRYTADRMDTGARAKSVGSPPEGVFSPIPTPFDADGSVDCDGLTRNLGHWIAAGLHGFVVLGSAGEGPLLSEEESMTVLRAARAAIPEDRWMIAGVGRHSTALTVAAARAAKKAGADAALVLPPYYYRRVTSEDALVAHYRAVVEGAGMPLLVYNMPAYTGLDLAPSAIVRLARLEGVVGIKDSSGDLGKLAFVRREASPSFSVLAGSAGFFVPALAAGASGGVLALANIAPESCLRLWSLARDGAWDDARELQGRLIPVNEAITRRWGPSGLKAALDVLGLTGGAPRPPLESLSEGGRGELTTVLRRAGLLPASEEVR
ncbi:MAG: dihydrodipicolinate synthase family protein [Candidatus Bipolaricaulota bacterium]|nr:MAG: dihydrodipicolinate synthase family protein [Candidatus Bipolaricaulota bacterium]